MTSLFSDAVLPLAPTFEHHHDGFGVQYARPRVSWRFSCSSDKVYNWRQTAYDIEIASDRGAEPIQFSHVRGENNVLVSWPAPEALKSRERRFVRVRCYGVYQVSDGGGEHRLHETVHESLTKWSSWSLLEVPLLHPGDWTALMITVAEPWPLSTDQSARPIRFHKRFYLDVRSEAVCSARLYATSHGVYTATINGRSVSHECLNPGFQSYRKKLHYQTYDAKDVLVAPGWNALEVEVAAGWFASATSWARKRFIYGETLGVMAQLEVWSTDLASPVVVATDQTWNATTTDVLSSEILDGEVVDYRLRSGITDSVNGPVSFPVRESPIPVSELVSPEAPPVRVVDRLEPRDMFKSGSGEATIVDFGQNVAGRIHVVRVRKRAGSRVTFRHAEVVQDGEMVFRPLRTAKATDILVCDGGDIVDWHPKYTYHGFRYVEITGWAPDDADGCPLTRASIVAEVMHSDMRRTGWFSCSDERVGRLHENSLWAIKGNFVSVPTECPSRDERFGWTGDANIIAPTANFLYDTAGMLRGWLRDLYSDQMDEGKYWRRGVVPMFVPNALLRNGDEDTGHAWDPMPNGVWGDAAVMIPWALFRMSGDVRFLSAQYDSMLQYLDNGVVRGHDGLWDPEMWQFGDWLDPRAPSNDSGRGTTDGTFVADCFLIASTRIVADVATLLEKPADSDRYRRTAETLARSWRHKYLSASGLVVPDTATALSLALWFGLVPVPGDGAAASTREQATARLCRLIRLHDFKITTGFVGSAFLPRALTAQSRNGADLAYAMLFQDKYPSYMYPVVMGATTTWERWDSMLPGGKVNPGSMTSFNHHALGSIAHWMHADIGGLDAIEPGWRVFRARPRPNSQLGWAETTYESRYGRIQLKWTLKDNVFRMELQVPPNSLAAVALPTPEEELSQPPLHQGKELRVGSGHYVFKCRFTQTEWPPKALLPPWGRAEF